MFNLDVAAMVLRQRNLSLFEQLLTLIREDEELFMEWTQKNYSENVLHYIFAEFEDKTSNNPDVVKEMAPFVDVLFRCCTSEQIKRLLSLGLSVSAWERMFSSISIPLFDYILKKLKSINDRQYLTSWFSLENPVLHALFKNKRESFALTESLLACYIEHHGAEQVAEYFMKKEMDLLRTFVLRHHNIRLLQYLYPLTKSNTCQYVSLLTNLLNENWQISSATDWLMEQREITTNHLLKYIKHFNEYQPKASAYVHLYVITHLWNIAERKGMSHESAIKTIQRHLFEVHQKLLLCQSNPDWQNPIDLSYIKTFECLFDSWLKRLSLEPKEVPESVSMPRSTGASLSFFSQSTSPSYQTACQACESVQAFSLRN